MTTSRPQDKTMLCTIDLITDPIGSDGNHPINKVNLNYAYRNDSCQLDNQDFNQLREAFWNIKQMISRYRSSCLSNFFRFYSLHDISFLLREKNGDNFKEITNIKMSGITANYAVEALDKIEDEVQKLANVSYWPIEPDNTCCGPSCC